MAGKNRGIRARCALTTLLGYYWGTPHSALSERVRAVVAWSPLAGEMIGVGVAVAGLVGLAAAAQAIALAMRTSDEHWLPRMTRLPV